jgi:protein involved in polysaccharide export with SLBB domain
VGVYGWVSHPGTFDVTAGMTVLGAVTAAGGAMFSSNVELLRTERGNRISIPLDLSKIESGKASDLPVKGGDVVLIKSSAVGAVPYGVYTLLSKFGTGLYLSPAMGL